MSSPLTPSVWAQRLIDLVRVLANNLSPQPDDPLVHRVHHSIIWEAMSLAKLKETQSEKAPDNHPWLASLCLYAVVGTQYPGTVWSTNTWKDIHLYRDSILRHGWQAEDVLQAIQPCLDSMAFTPTDEGWAKLLGCKIDEVIQARAVIKEHPFERMTEHERNMWHIAMELEMPLSQWQHALTLEPEVLTENYLLPRNMVNGIDHP